MEATTAGGSSEREGDLWASAKTPGNFGDFDMTSARTPGYIGHPINSPGGPLNLTPILDQDYGSRMDEDIVDNIPPGYGMQNVTTPAWFGNSPVPELDNTDNAAYTRAAIYEQMKLDQISGNNHSRTPAYIASRTPGPFSSNSIVQGNGTSHDFNNGYGNAYTAQAQHNAFDNFEQDAASSLMDASLITHTGNRASFRPLDPPPFNPYAGVGTNNYDQPYTGPDLLTVEMDSMANTSIPPMSFFPRRLPASHPAAKMISGVAKIPEMQPPRSTFATPKAKSKPRSRKRQTSTSTPTPKNTKKSPHSTSRLSATARAYLGDDDDDNDNDEHSAIPDSEEATPSTTTKKGKGKGSRQVRKPAKERIRKAPKNGITPTKPIPRSLAECDEADRTMVSMRDAGSGWPAIRRAYAALDGSQHGTSTLPNRYERLKANFVLVRDEDNALIVEVKREVEEKFAEEKWGLIAEAVESRGGGGYDGVTLQRQYKKLMEQQGFNVGDGLARNDVDFATEHDRYRRVHRMNDDNEDADGEAEDEGGAVAEVEEEVDDEDVINRYGLARNGSGEDAGAEAEYDGGEEDEDGE